jgi:hypothetical protein
MKEGLLENSSIEIRRCNNGVIVSTPYNSRNDSVCVSTDMMVFDSKEDFVKWVADFFPAKPGTARR